MSDLTDLTIAEASDRIRARELSPLELTEAYLRRIELLNTRINAYVTIASSRALDDARRATDEVAAGTIRGRLHGIPIALKDLFATAGIRTTAGSKILADWVPEQDSTVGRRLHEAGAVLLGKYLAYLVCTTLVVLPSVMIVYFMLVPLRDVARTFTALVTDLGLLAIGIAAGVLCYLAATSMKHAFGYDDSLDVFGIHGIGGMVGAILTGVFAVEAIGGTPGLLEGNPGQIMPQIYGILATVVWCGVASLVILKVIDATIGLRVSAEVERDSLDLQLHGETVQ